MNKQIKDFTVEELKAAGFDLKNQLEALSQQLQMVYGELQARAEAPKEDKKKK